jgi:hypothetical protein
MPERGADWSLKRSVRGDADRQFFNLLVAMAVAL